MSSAAGKETSMIVMIIAVAVGGGAVLLVTTIVLLMAAICWLTKKHKKFNASHNASATAEQHHEDQIEKPDKSFEVQEQSAVLHAELLVELKNNEAYGWSSQQISTEENVAYGQTMLPQISTEGNVAYGHTGTAHKSS